MNRSRQRGQTNSPVVNVLIIVTLIMACFAALGSCVRSCSRPRAAVPTYQQGYVPQQPVNDNYVDPGYQEQPQVVNNYYDNGYHGGGYGVGMGFSYPVYHPLPVITPVYVTINGRRQLSPTTIRLMRDRDRRESARKSLYLKNRTAAETKYRTNLKSSRGFSSTNYGGLNQSSRRINLAKTNSSTPTQTRSWGSYGSSSSGSGSGWGGRRSSSSSFGSSWGSSSRRSSGSSWGSSSRRSYSSSRRR